MKYLFTFCLIFFLAANMQAQDNGRVDAGMYLTRSANNFKASYITAGAAGICVALSPLNPDYKRPLLGIGLGFGVVSLVTRWGAYTNLQKAGAALQTTGLTVTPNGFAYRF